MSIVENIVDIERVYTSQDDITLEIENVRERIKEVSREYELIRASQQLLEEDLEVIKDNLEWLRKTTTFSDYIYNKLRDLPEETNSEIVNAYQSFVRVKHHEVKKSLMMINKSEDGWENLTELAVLYEALSQELSSLIKLTNDYSILIQESRTLLQEQQVWTYTNAPIWANLSHLDSTLLFGTDDPMGKIINNIGDNKSHILTFYFILFTLMLLLVKWWSRLKLNIISIHQAKIIGNPLKDGFSNTVTVLAMTFLASLILPVFYLNCVWLLNNLIGKEFYTSFDTIFLSSLGLLWAFDFVYHLSRKQGMLELHFGWEEETCLTMHKKTRLIIYPLFILMLVFLLFRLVSDGSKAEILRIVFLLIVLLLFVACTYTLKSKKVRMNFPVFFRSGLGYLTLFYALSGSFLLIVIMGVVGLYVASWKVFLLQQLNILCLTGVFLLFQLGVRWLILEQRQLSYQRFVARREEKIARESSGVMDESTFIEMEGQGLNKEAINEQSMTVLKGLCLIVLFTLLSTIWSSQLELTNWMDEVVLWQINQSVGGSTQLVDITLKAVLFTLLTLIITFVSIRNLPGILELLILRRISLPPGTGYTITTLVRYALTLIGVSIAFTTIGLEWERLQWLVAAIGVGLGFGLQEIFANFISGLILLFERPIRIGDTVTINELSGTVSKIKTRSTTIIDWDNKEIVVPNKVFITDKLVNWSLTDSVTRIVIPVGVAYDSDIDLVETLLYQSANRVPVILKVPPPTVYFLTFGDSCLEFELRVHINSIDDRLPTIHLLNKSINRLFKDNNVEISYPQLDVHMK
ncbi:mechanosensitive ion channel domain-containing protein [Vibrio sp. YIC-376]|uniref:mechanosensitive ion channel domain-containing protein n=1 Tax=Vibrio sp. YIC-376 TaxID=3136162 RepID=UPI00402A7F0C